MRLIGSKWICDRCQKEEFTEEETTILPNGKEVRKAKLPEGWGYSSDARLLCKNCFEKYEKLRAEFFGEKR